MNLTAALYYPHIHFRSRRWLRAALLYYDEISRIVPVGFEPDHPSFYYEFENDPVELLNDISLLKGTGFIKDVPPDQISEVGNEFFDFAMKNLTDPARRAALVPKLARRNRSYTIHPEKIDPELLSILRELKLAHEKQHDPYSDWEIEPVTGGLYMLFLATRMAGQRQLVSDSSIYQSLLYSPILKSSEPHGDDRQFRLATAVLKRVVPADLEQLSMDNLLRLRDESAADRQRFQDKIASFAGDLQKSTPQQLQETIERHARTLGDEYESHLDKLRSLNVGVAQGLFSVSIPSYLTSPWGFASTSHPLIFAAGVIAMSATVMKYMFERQSAGRSPFTYLLSLNRMLNTENMAQNIIQLNLNLYDDEGDDDRRVMLRAIT
jgi:hypothetical protein